MASIIHCGVVCNTLLETACLISQTGHWHWHMKFHEMREDLVFNTTENVPSKWTPMSSSQNPTKCLQYHKSLHCPSSCPHQTPPKSKRVLCVEPAPKSSIVDAFSTFPLHSSSHPKILTLEYSCLKLPKYSWPQKTPVKHSWLYINTVEVPPTGRLVKGWTGRNRHFF